jgi:anti-anti-sigma regulatory factor
LLLRGEQPPDPEAGWSAFRAIHQDESIGRHQNIKLLGPQPQVERTLQMTGLKEFFEIHDDRATAVASFQT